MRHRWARDRVGQDGGYRERRGRDPFRHLADDGELEMKFVMKERQAMDIQAPPAQRQRIYGGPSGRLPASLRRAGGCERLNLNSGEFRDSHVLARLGNADFAFPCGEVFSCGA